MFKLKVADAKLLRDMATAISILVDEATFQITPEALKLRAMDPSRVAMVDFEWPKTVFEEYVCTEPAKMCINIGELLKLLKKGGQRRGNRISLRRENGTLTSENNREIHAKLHNANPRSLRGGGANAKNNI
jgi:proliferating cell nuclear antigen